MRPVSTKGNLSCTRAPALVLAVHTASPARPARSPRPGNFQRCQSREIAAAFSCLTPKPRSPPLPPRKSPRAGFRVQKRGSSASLHGGSTSSFCGYRGPASPGLGRAACGEGSPERGFGTGGHRPHPPAGREGPGPGPHPQTRPRLPPAGAAPSPPLRAGRSSGLTGSSRLLAGVRGGSGGAGAGFSVGPGAGLGAAAPLRPWQRGQRWSGPAPPAAPPGGRRSARQRSRKVAAVTARDEGGV